MVFDLLGKYIKPSVAFPTNFVRVPISTGVLRFQTKYADIMIRYYATKKKVQDTDYAVGGNVSISMQRQHPYGV